ncbi:hypothetical protein HDU93_009600 [Gonapodya sp. JEL0774]|nr:hypothetical protein HDU93_009600 [Gonapodya sp. JEL0774]
MATLDYQLIESSETNPLDFITIGGGPSSIVALRNALKSNLTRIASFERDDDTGGLWYKHTAKWVLRVGRIDNRKAHGAKPSMNWSPSSSYASLQVTTTDWTLHGVPIRDGEPGRRASRDSIMQWCRDYINKFKLAPYMYFAVKVVKAEPVRVSSWQDSLWRVTVAKVANPAARTWETVPGSEKIVYTRSVLVCTGLEQLPKKIKIPGEETATFPIVHNLVIRSEKDFPSDSKEIVVIGAGPSSMDIAQLAAVKTKIPTIYLAHRRQHLGLPDLWWPWAWKLGITEISITHFLYGTLALPSCSYDVSYALRSECLPAYHQKRLKIIIAEPTKIEKDTLHFSNGVVSKPQMVVEATGWNLDMSWIPVRSSYQFADLQPRLFGRFIDVDYPGLYWVSIANGFMCANHNADMVTQCITQILNGKWKQPTMATMEKQIKEVVLPTIFVPGRALAELRACGFQVVQG